MIVRVLARRIVPAFLVSLVLALTALAAEHQPCDMKTVEKGFYCETDQLVLGKKDLVAGKVHYVCPSCKEMAKKSGKCGSCQEKLEKKVSDKGVCPTCFAKPQQVQVCVKTGYACPKCGAKSLKARKCGGCKATHKKTVSRSLIHYVCPGCNKSSYLSGKCKDKECKNTGQALVKACKSSGEVPHVTVVKPEKDGKKNGKKKK